MSSITTLVVCLFLSAFFSACETAFTSLSLVQIQELKQRYKRQGLIVESLYQSPDRLLTTILIGNNIANVGISVISSAITIDLFGSVALGITTAIVTMVILIFGEILPKQFAIRNNEAICIHTARIIKALAILFLPIIWISTRLPILFSRGKAASGRDHFTPDSILNMVKYAENTGKIENYKTKIVQSVFRFSDITVHAIMTHRQEVFSLDQNLSVEEVIPAIIKDTCSRIPVYLDNPENITGVVLAKDILYLSADRKTHTILADIANSPVFIPETWKIHRVFHKLKDEVLNMGIVLDEYGGLAGIVTMEDLVEEIIGELYDEGEEPDEEKVCVSPLEGWYNVRGDAPIHLLEDIIGHDIERDRNAETAGGYVTRKLSALPVKEQIIETDIGTFVIQSMSKKRVQKMRYKPVTEEP